MFRTITHTPHPYPLPTGARVLFGSLALLLAMAAGAFGQTTLDLNLGINLIAVPVADDTTDITDAEVLRSRIHVPWVVRTNAPRQRERAQFEVYLPAHSVAFPIVRGRQGYLVVSPADATVSLSPIPVTPTVFMLTLYQSGNRSVQFVQPDGSITSSQTVSLPIPLHSSTQDGQYIYAFQKDPGGYASTLYRVKLASGATTIITTRAGSSMIASPDLQFNPYDNAITFIIHTYDGRISHGLYSRNVATGLYGYGGEITNANVSQPEVHGSLFYAIAEQFNSSGTFRLMRTTPFPPIEITPQTLLKGIDSYNLSPDGAKIVLVSRPMTADTDREIWLMDADGGNVQKITDNAVDDWAAVFRPDGNAVMFLSNRQGNGFLHEIDLATRAVRTVARPTISGSPQYVRKPPSSKY